MTVKEILASAAGMLGRADVADFLENGVGSDVKALESERDVLLRCYNSVEREMACDYRPLRFTESIASNGFVGYSALSKRPVEVEKVIQSGVQVPFIACTEGVKTPQGVVEIAYRYVPERKAADDESDYTERESRALASGVACEYSLACGLYEQALTWDARYKAALAALCRGRGMTLKMRRWI